MVLICKFSQVYVNAEPDCRSFRMTNMQYDSRYYATYRTSRGPAKLRLCFAVILVP